MLGWKPDSPEVSVDDAFPTIDYHPAGKEDLNHTEDDNGPYTTARYVLYE